MTDEALMTLALRVEALSGPERLLEWDIWDALGKPPVDEWSKAGCAPRYTASLDAAITLVEGPQEYPTSKTFVVDCAGQTTVHLGMAVAHVWNDTGKNTAVAKTPALALTAAALRARALDQAGEGR
jgi:hypothetical protein